MPLASSSFMLYFLYVPTLLFEIGNYNYDVFLLTFFTSFTEGIYKKLISKVIDTYLQSLMNSVWYVSVPYLIPLSKPRGVSVSTTSSNSNTFRSLTVIQRNIALKHNHNNFGCTSTWADFWWGKLIFQIESIGLSRDWSGFFPSNYLHM